MKNTFVKSDLGYIEISGSPYGVSGVRFVDQKEHDNTPTCLKEAKKQLEEYLEGSRKQFDLEFVLQGTEFQVKVWQALLDIPYGETRSYKDIAVAIGNPKAVRAIGMANNKNHIGIMVPCHRVIGANGDLVGYAGGLQYKEYLLQLETNAK